MMSKKERLERKRIREKLIEDGILPKPKKKVNRKKYVNELVSKFKELEGNEMYAVRSGIVTWCIGRISDDYHVTDEAMAIARIVDIAMREVEFNKKIRAEGKNEYTVDEFYEEVYSKVYLKDEYNKAGDNDE